MSVKLSLSMHLTAFWYEDAVLIRSRISVYDRVSMLYRCITVTVAVIIIK